MGYWDLIKTSLCKNSAGELPNCGEREVCGELKECFSHCASCSAHLQKESHEVKKLRHSSKLNPLPRHQRQGWEHSLATCHATCLHLPPPAADPAGSRVGSCAQVCMSRMWCGRGKSGQQHLVNSQIKAWSSSCYSQEGLLLRSVLEKGLRKFGANVITFSICTKKK